MFTVTQHVQPGARSQDSNPRNPGRRGQPGTQPLASTHPFSTSKSEAPPPHPGEGTRDDKLCREKNGFVEAQGHGVSAGKYSCVIVGRPGMRACCVLSAGRDEIGKEISPSGGRPGAPTQFELV